jgi:hypothetical protein
MRKRLTMNGFLELLAASRDKLVVKGHNGNGKQIWGERW